MPLVRSAGDVIDVLGAPEIRPSAAPAAPDIAPVPAPEAALAASATETEIDAHILTLLSSAPMEEDQLIRDLGLPANAVAPRLVMLEIRGRVLRALGGTLTKA